MGAVLFRRNAVQQLAAEREKKGRTQTLPRNRSGYGITVQFRNEKRPDEAICKMPKLEDIEHDTLLEGKAYGTAALIMKRESKEPDDHKASR